jgi:hypothetical protein
VIAAATATVTIAAIAPIASSIATIAPIASSIATIAPNERTAPSGLIVRIAPIVLTEANRAWIAIGQNVQTVKSVQTGQSA